MPYVRVRGIEVYYEEHGSGRSLIVAHGMLGSVAAAPAHAGLRAADIASHGIRVISYDARGHGRSGYTARPADYHWTALGDDMLGVIDALGLERTSIYGSSMGAGAALMLALAHPERVERLVLRSPPALGADLRRSRKQFGGLAFLYACFGASLTARIVAMLPGSDRGDATLALLGDQRPAAIVGAIRGLLFGRSQLPLERMAEITAPALILTHAGDGMHPLRSGETLRAHMPGATLTVAPSPDHWRKNPAALTAIVASFVRGDPA